MVGASAIDDTGSNTNRPARERGITLASSAWIAGMVVVSVALHALGAAIDVIPGARPWVHQPLHSAIEAAGATIGLTVAALLLLMPRLGRGTRFGVPLALGLSAMAALDGLHALGNTGAAFVWLHSMATLAGGLLFALMLLPASAARATVWIAAGLTLGLLGLGAVAFATPEALPAITTNGKLNALGMSMNAAGGVLMLLAALRLAASSHVSGRRDDQLFAVQCVLFGSAAFMFDPSQTWQPSWWWWHLLRLAAYGVAFGFAIMQLLRIQADTVHHRDELTAAHDEVQRSAAEQAGELMALRAAMDNHTLFSIADARGRIVDVNEGFCRISGYTREELLGQDHRLLNSGHHPKSFWVDMWKTIASGQPWRAEVCNRAKDGSLYWVDSTNIPQRGSDGSIERYISLRFDITDQKTLQGRLDMATKAARIGLWDWDLKADTTYFSDTFYTMLGYEPGELPMCLQTWVDLVHPDDLENAVADIERHKNGETSIYVNEHRLLTKSGDWLWIRDIGEVVERSQDGTPLRMLGVHVDVQEMRDAIEAANQANASKSDFLANMSHEIRTPMTAILGYAELLTSDDEIAADAARSTELAGSIQSNANHLLTIINDVLDVSKIEAGQMTVERIEVDPAKIMQEVVSLVRPRAAGKGISLRAHFDTPIPTRISSDPTRIRQILLNLAGNAIKFTETGGVTLHAACDPETQTMRFRVVDTGIGMNPEQLASIESFRAFNQADASTTRTHGGTGLGLRISNALATMLGGGITIRSERGVGSEFIATLSTGSLEGVRMVDPSLARMDGASETSAPSQASGVAGKPLAGIRVLLAEDGPDNQKLISFHLRKAGAEVVVCDDGLAAVEHLDQAGPDEMPNVVLMDMQMPRLDGYGAARHLRDKGSTLPIIALTAHAMDGERQKCINAGCDEYLTKPIDKAAVIATCARLAINVDRRNAA